MVLALSAGCDDAPPALIDTRDAAADASDAKAPGDGASDVSDAPVEPRYEVLTLDAMRSQFPDATATRGGRGYVALRSLGRVIEVSADGSYRAYAEAPSGSTVRGVAFDATGRLLLSVVHPTPAQSGLWRVDAGGGVATLVAHNDGLVNPGGIAVDSIGTVWVTDSDPGAVWTLPMGATSLTRWSNDASLAGGAVVCGPTNGVRTGANGIVVDGARGLVYVTNSDLSSLVRIGIAADGSAGAVVVSTRDCPRLAGAWGLAMGPGGSLLVAAGLVNKITRVAPDGTLTALDTPMGLLRSPAGLAFDRDLNVAWIANSANADATRPGGMPVPGVVRLPITP